MGILLHGHCPHGKPTPEYRAYYAMRNRCLNVKQKRYKDYGGRGITICDRWLNGEGDATGFQCFLADMGQKPSQKHTLERERNDEGYSPDNCRWATRQEQALNTRGVRMVKMYGTELPLIEAVARWGAVPYGTVVTRLWRGWPVEEAIGLTKGSKPTTRAAERITIVQ
jgi:hypothetical protein